jgi:hypothetical protein
VYFLSLPYMTRLRLNPYPECGAFSKAFSAAHESAQQALSNFSSPDTSLFRGIAQSPSWGSQMEKIFEATMETAERTIRTAGSPSVSPSEGPSMPVELPLPYLLPAAQSPGEAPRHPQAGPEIGRTSPRRSLQPSDLIFPTGYKDS